MHSQDVLKRSGENAHPSGSQLVLASLAAFSELAVRRRLRLGSERLRRSYRLCDGRSNRVFGETVRPLPDTQRTVIEVGFRLKLIRIATLPHRMFQRLLTTPFWSGFDGFGTKLWMVDPHTRSYADIYEWSAPAMAAPISMYCRLCCAPCRCRS